MGKRAFVAALLATLLGSCAIQWQTTGLGRLGGRVLVMWVGEDRFVYVPAPKEPFYFETANYGRRIAPGLMYTDGGSIPRFAQGLKGFSPWGYGPAYVVHDWIFFGHHCIIDGFDDHRFDSVRDITFDESALVLAEVIRTLVDYGQVPANIFAADAISNAVDSAVALGIWNQQGACKPVSSRHIAAVMNALGISTPPPSWGLSPTEISAARAERKFVPKAISVSGH